MSKYIFYCKSCKNAFSNNDGAEKGYFVCPECGKVLTPTDFSVTEWRSKSDTEKAALKKTFDTYPDAKYEDDPMNQQLSKSAIGIVLIILGIILMLVDSGGASELAVNTCLKCWGKGWVENAYGIAVDCSKCSGGQAAYISSSFGVAGAIGTFSAIAGGVLLYIHKKFD